METTVKLIQKYYKNRLDVLDSLQPDYGRAVELTRIIIDLLQKYNNIPKFQSTIMYNGQTLYLHNIRGTVVYTSKRGDEIFIPPDYYEHINREKRFLMMLLENQQSEAQIKHDLS